MVVDTLGPGIDLLVIGGEVSELEDEARQYNLLAMTEQKLVEFLDTTFRPASR